MVVVTGARVEVSEAGLEVAGGVVPPGGGVPVPESPAIAVVIVPDSI